ncbi:MULTISPECIES: urea ABC transporter permease subunit UrtB [unclassified Undibacterium]|uniref:urea ABC transporter permease subunit UrtB n=1 Tax=unclassified Undibacterium TaxID=2630295 RepID=UPI002AC9D498|nr:MULTISPECIES: urea ABC transporter permease subunit UrtB [unclassified Undibacterium]MEB0139301.1 urea ABC transporter permease subunit UrtB [Undibacterium sp. CCC2.1]MEB0172145.1 urea ABC transporter permease subunit UrtB [Undibacterium sp. CCC1.1]MEB0176064.1 urea ABC transporter permease subunit UrtB [Undibacterium sp. CCC3.4]MEB0215376.1 urea ABC transporter permease subunit UrtB [Undibacterium sp. 5I2]WPX45694.1 urea ABC transporter permease subunit UrtB [Undibacterium sp. CCC3.4]
MILRKILLCCGILLLSYQAQAKLDVALCKALAGDDPDARIAAVNSIAALGSAEAAATLRALNQEELYFKGDTVYLAVGEQATDLSSGVTANLPDGADVIPLNNRLRGALQSALSGIQLFSSNKAERLTAAIALQKQATPEQLPLLNAAYIKEKDPQVGAELQLLIAAANLQSDDAALRLAAVKTLINSTNAGLRPQLQKMLTKNADGSDSEPEAAIRIAAVASLQAIDRHIAWTELIGNLFYGVSLGSVLLLAALGLAVSFGLMGIINMAHGELLMIGAYTTYVCQMVFRHYFPGALDAYLLAALPAAFLVSGGIGMLLERSVIRWLYGRPLETLLCTWGISLMLMQAVRSIFGAQNVEVANPSWMSGGVTVMGSLVLSYNRIIIIFFALAVVAAVWLILNKTRLGLFVRAVTQNRRMADCVGVATGKIDMLTFGLGSGIAGLGGVALSQLGNVGPDLGQNYIVDSFMVVVLGGVGQLAGTVLAAFGLGEVNKFLEPLAGAVMAKIVILVFIIIFIQRRPQGLFALKGRSVE